MTALNTLPIRHFTNHFFDMHDSDSVEVDGEIITQIPEVMGTLGHDVINKTIYIGVEHDGKVAVDASWTITLDRAHLDRLKSEGRDNAVLNSEAFETGEDSWLKLYREHMKSITDHIKSAVPSAMDVSGWAEDLPFSLFATFTVNPDATIGDVEETVRPFFEFMEKATAPDAPDEDYIFGRAVLGK